MTSKSAAEIPQFFCEQRNLIIYLPHHQLCGHYVASAASKFSSVEIIQIVIRRPGLSQ